MALRLVPPTLGSFLSCDVCFPCSFFHPPGTGDGEDDDSVSHTPRGRRISRRACVGPGTATAMCFALCLCLPVVMGAGKVSHDLLPSPSLCPSRLFHSSGERALQCTGRRRGKQCLDYMFHPTDA
ncbi:unnamed protein product [Prorocentrum cordatum]|uniref:Uncharacterized protein n=1 Tax=Prorocentrum cordatum TaxID=2364126 RepID=A0ABN9XZ95_9DINO|nr:unnamed protein product [Polarella glacialis]